LRHGQHRVSPRIQAAVYFVGGEAPADYALQIEKAIANIEGGRRIEITGFVPRDAFVDYLAAADTAVQLRTLSRGETSGAVLDCLAFGLPVIVNTHGSLDEYPATVLLKLADEFKTGELVTALERLWADTSLRSELSRRSTEYIRVEHSSRRTVDAYVEVIERTARSLQSQCIVSAVDDHISAGPLAISGASQTGAGID